MPKSSLFSTGILIILILGLGLFFRFTNLEKKIYWFDEMMTSVQISGYSREEIKKELFAAHEVTYHDIRKYQRVDPKRTMLHTIRSLARENPQHPPLYFILARLWAELYGDSVGGIRSLSVFISLLAIPGLYWLSLELFGSARTVWTAIVLMAVSPFQLLYAQEARSYSLWLLMTILSSAALLRAMRLKTGLDWGFYTLTLIGGIYSHLLFGLVVVGHGIYVASLTKLSFEKCSPYFLACVTALAAFAPWALLILLSASELHYHNSWVTTTEVGILDAIKRWTMVFSSAFIDTGGVGVLRVNFSFDSSWIHLIRLPVLLLIAYSFYFLYRKASHRNWLFILALTGSSVLPLMLADLILGWQLSAHPRFLTPYYLGSLLAVAYYLSTQMASPNFLKRRVCQTICVSLVVGGVVSCATISRAEFWWNKGASESLEEARLISQVARPLLIATSDSAGFFAVSSLSHLLDPRISIRWVTASDTLQIFDGFTDVFFLNPPDHLRRRFEKESLYRIEPIYNSGKLWRLTRNL